ncbi:MAG TPA: 50S ribosomal protein L3 N(5)-glutamine methyltransferase [Usitatibacter sp.]|nr:50S ribosomal protein L3 N(5)-glutamine methyltransferase [Usitatibacter sp.]
MKRPRTVRALLEYGVKIFEEAGLSYGHGTTNALDEAAWLILRALELPPGDINPHLDRSLDAARFAAAKSLLDQRVATRKPAAYLLHEAWLGPHRFYVDERVIVPRSFIAELLLEKRGQSPFSLRANGVPPKRKRGLSPFLDLCTGSGCLAILAALRFPDAHVDAVDLSDEALQVAARNVADYGLGNRIALARSDLFSALEGRTYDVIVSNPPYVKAASMRTLPDEYRKEPRMALASGADGLEHTRAILAQAHAHLNPGGVLVVEVGHNRRALERAFPRLAFDWPKTSAGSGFVFAIAREQLA